MMKNIVMNIRGTNGSGKSYIAHFFKKFFGVHPLVVDGKIVAYRVLCTPKLYLVGKYETKTGGCDTIQKMPDVFSRVRALAKFGDVLFEGLLVSGITTRLIELNEQVNLVLFVLDTPIEKCIERVNYRRRQKGNLKPLDPKNLLQKYRAVQSTKKSLTEAGLDIVDLDHTIAVKTILNFGGYRHAKK